MMWSPWMRYGERLIRISYSATSALVVSLQLEHDWYNLICLPHM